MIKDTLPTPTPNEDIEEDIDAAVGESEAEDVEDSPKKRKRGARLTELRKTLSEANETGEDEEMLDEKIEFLLEEASYQEPSIDDFLGTQTYYTTESTRSDKSYVQNMERRFGQSQRLAKVAEAIAGQSIRDGELFPSTGDIRTVVNNPVTRYDDIANGIDQAVTLITDDGKTVPFAFDITIGHSDDTVIKKLFRPYKTPNGEPLGAIGQSRLKYAQEPTLDKNGEYASITHKTIDPIPRFTLAYDERDVLQMASLVTVEKGFDEGQVDVYTNPESATILNTTLQIYEQCVFFTEAAKVKRNEINQKIAETEDEAEIAKLNQQLEEIKQQIEDLKELTKTLEPTLKDAYVRARKETIPSKDANDAKTNDTIRRKLFSAGFLGSPTGKFIDSMHYYEGYSDGRDEEEEKLIQKYIEAEKSKIRKQHPNSFLEPSYTRDQVIEMEYNATMQAKRDMLEKYRHRMPERLEEGFQKYDEIEQRNLEQRLSA